MLKPHAKPRPNKWPCKPEDFGPCYDYRLIPLDDHTAIYAASEAALQWLYKYLPEWIDRVSDKGFKVETRWVGMITRQMRDAGLISVDEYMEGCEENDRAGQYDGEIIDDYGKD